MLPKASKICTGYEIRNTLELLYVAIALQHWLQWQFPYELKHSARQPPDVINIINSEENKCDRVRNQLRISDHPITRLRVRQYSPLVSEFRSMLRVTTHRKLDSRPADGRLSICNYPLGTRNVVLHHTLIRNRVARRRLRLSLTADKV